MQFYKRDIIQRKVSSENNKLEWCWGADLIGINEDTEVDGYVLWSRPFKNKLKQLMDVITCKGYKLTFWQKLELIPLRIYWFLYTGDDRKNWHDVKKGMEKHEHKFTKSFSKMGYEFRGCEHQGCTLAEPIN